MIPEEVHANIDERQVNGQGQAPAEPPSVTPPAPRANTIPASQGAPPSPRASIPPPPGRLATSVQRMPPGGRWALGLVLAFLSGVVYLFSPYVGFGNIPFVGTALAVLVLCGLALAAGFVLSSWWAVVALAVAAIAGGVVATWLFLLIATGAAAEWPLVAVGFVVLVLVALIFFLLGGVGLGKQQGLALGEPRALSSREAGVSRWIAALAPVLGAGYLAPPVGYLPGMQLGIEFTISSIFYAVVLAASCLLAGWLLRSWRGLVIAPLVYAGVAVLATVTLPWFGGGGDWQVWPTGFALYILLPAVLMSAIGTAIGMYQDRLAASRPPHVQA